jgi:hypothetical protein
MTDKELKEAAQWFVQNFGAEPADKSVFITWLCGRFRTWPRRAQYILEEMVQENLATITKDKKVKVKLIF